MQAQSQEQRIRELKQANEIISPGGDGSPTQVMVDFIDDHRDSYGVEQICRVLSITPSTYYREKYLANNLEKRSFRISMTSFIWVKSDASGRTVTVAMVRVNSGSRWKRTV